MQESNKKIISFQERLQRQYIFFINSFSLLAIVALLVFAIVNAANHNYFLGIVELTIAVVLIVNLALLWISRNTKLCAFILLCGFSILLLILFITGGIARTGIYWFFAFPPAAFFLTGKRSALLWLCMVYVSILIITILNSMGKVYVPYSIVEIRQLLIAHSVVSTILYIYENTRRTFELELEENRKMLEKKVIDDIKST